MEGTYDIYQGDQRIGTAEVAAEGLYYHFYCKCALSGEVICRITVNCGGQTHSLGLPVPEGDGFVLRTRMPIKRLGRGEPKFRAIPKHRQVGGRFVPISPEEPFRYLSRLENAVLERRGEQLGVLLPEDPTEVPAPDLPGSGPNP